MPVLLEAECLKCRKSIQRQKPALGIVHGENSDTGVPNPFEAKQFPVSMP